MIYVPVWLVPLMAEAPVSPPQRSLTPPFCLLVSVSLLERYLSSMVISILLYPLPIAPGHSSTCRKGVWREDLRHFQVHDSNPPDLSC